MITFPSVSRGCRFAAAEDKYQEEIRALTEAIQEINSKAVGCQSDNNQVVRFGLNADFIKEQNPTWIDNLVTSSGGRQDNPRHRDHFKPYVQDYLERFGARKVEANALVVRPDAGRQLCRDAIEQFIDVEAIAEYRDRIQEMQAEVRKLLPDVMRSMWEMSRSSMATTSEMSNGSQNRGVVFDYNNVQ